MILEGTTSTGAVVPVQVTTDGKVVAEGMTGPEGPQGPEGPEGPQGPEGPAGAPGNLWSGSDPGSIYYTGGSVGIGSSSPDQTLSVGSGAADTRMSINGTGQYQLKFTNSGANGFWIGSPGADSLAFAQNDGTTRMTIDSSGRLGIGSTSPSTQLDVIGGGTQALFQGGTNQNGLIRIRPNGSAGSSQIAFDNAAATSSANITCVGGATLYIDSASNGDIAHRTNGTGAHVWTVNSGGSEAARIDSSGRLLVGTTSAPPMTAAGDVVSSGAFCLKSPDGNWWAIEVNNSGTLTATALI